MTGWGPVLPLRYQLPNPPAVFVGRAREVEWLRRALGSGPLAVVTGAAGAGKTAVVVHAIRDLFGDRFSTSIYVHVRAGTAPALEVARTLAEVSGLTDADWSHLSRDPEALAALLIDLAESEPFWLVVDGLERADPRAAQSLLLTVATYARQSRWICTSAEPFRHAELAGRVLALPALSTEALAELADASSPNATRAEIERAVTEAGGSPLSLLEGLFGAPDVAPESDAPATPTNRLLGLLATSAVGLPPEVLSAAGVGDPELAADLERRGLLERSAGQVWLRDEAKDHPNRSVTAHDLSAALDGQDAPELVVERVRLLLETGRPDEAASLLEQRWQELLGAGRAPDVWSLLEGRTEAALAATRLRCAVELGDPDILTSLHEPTEKTPAVRLAWANALLARGRITDADKEAQSLAAVDIADARYAWETRLLRARCAMAAERFGEALAIVTEGEPPDAADAARADALKAGCLALLGAHGEAMAEIERLADRWDALPGRARADVGLSMAQTLYAVGSLVAARQRIERVLGSGGSPFAYNRGRWLIAIGALVHLDLGDLDRAVVLLERLTPLLAGSSPLSLSVSLARCGHRLASGRLNELDSALDALVVTSLERDNADHAYAAAAFRTELACARGEPPPAWPDGFDQTEPSELMDALFDIRSRVAGARVGTTSASLVLPAYPSHPEAQILASILRAQHALASGDVAAAGAEATDAVERAGRARYRVREAEARATRCDALGAAGSFEGMATEAGRLAELAAALPSPRYTAAARLFQALAHPDSPEPGLLSTLAESTAAPETARRAAHLMGRDVVLDAVDRRVLDAFVRVRGWSAPTLVRSSDDPAAEVWGIDLGAQSVWLPDDRRVSLAKSQLLWRLILALATRGGRATKEEIVCECWDRSDYHPLKDDNRLHTAVRKLRKAIEDDPKAPRRLVTTDEGYELGGTVHTTGS